MSTEKVDFLKDFDDWIEVTGALPRGTSWHAECRSIVEDAQIQGKRLAEKVIAKNNENSELLIQNQRLEDQLEAANAERLSMVRMIWLIVNKMGGEIRVTTREMIDFDPKRSELSTYDDILSTTRVIQAKRKL